jgi:HEPN domain-containing protein
LTKTRTFKKEYAPELLNVASEDLQTARVLAHANLVRKENILFHVQQAVEKALKANLVHIGIPVPLAHDLQELVTAQPDRDAVPHSESLYDLTQFATIRRYEEGIAVITAEEISASLAAAQDVIDWVKRSVK